MLINIFASLTTDARSGGYLKTKLKPKEEDTKVSASTKKTVAAVAVGAQKGAQVSGIAVQMMSTMTQALASSIAEGVQSTDYYRSIKNGKKKRNPPSSTATQVRCLRTPPARLSLPSQPRMPRKGAQRRWIVRTALAWNVEG